MPAAATLVVQVLADVQNMQNNLKKGEMSLQSFARGATNIGKQMSTWVTLPIVAAGVAVTKMAMDFESQMTLVYTLMDEGTIKSRDWGAAILEMSKETGEATGTLSKGFYDVVSSGFKANEALGLLEVSTKAAKAGMTDTATSVKAITATLNAYSMKASQAGKVADVMFQTVNKGVITFEELAGSLGLVVGTASVANVSFEEVGAAVATMTLGGLSAEESMVSLNQVMLTFIKPTKEASELASQLGLDFSATALSTKGLGGTIEDLVDKMNISIDDIYELEKAGKSSNEIWDEMAVKAGLTSEQFAILFPNVRALRGVLMLAKDEGASFKGMLDGMNDSAGATDEAFSKIAETTQFKFDLALSSLKATGIELGTKLLPLASKAMGTISDLANRFSDLDDATQSSILAWAGLIAVAPVVVLALGKIVTSIITLRTAYESMNVALLMSPLSTGKFATGLLGVGAAASQVAGQGVPAIAWFMDIIGLSKSAAGEFGKAINLMKGAALKSHFDFAGAFGETGPAGGGTWTQQYAREVQDLLMSLQNAAPDIQREALAMVEAFRQTGQTEDDVYALSKSLAELNTTASYVSTTVQANTEDIMQYRFVNEELISTLQGVESEYANGLISSEQYAQAVAFLADTSGSFKGTIVDVYSAVGILNQEQVNAAQAAAETQGAFQEEKKSAEELQKEIDDLMDSIFRLYNLDQSVTEASWAYDDALKNLDKTMKNKQSTTREIEKAQFDAQDALEDYMISIKKELESGDISAAKKKELADKWVELGKAAEESGQASSESFDELTERLGININQNIIPNLESMMGTMSTVDKTKANPQVGMNTSAFYSSLSGVQSALSSLGKTNVNPTINPPKVPKGYINGIPFYQHGGTVEGMIGEPKLAVVHGGEKILNPYEPDSFKSQLSSMFPEIGGPSIQNIFNIGELAVREEADIDRIAEQLYIKQKTLSRGQGIK